MWSSSLVYFHRPSTARVEIPGEDEPPRTDGAEMSAPDSWLVFSASREPVGISPSPVTGEACALLWNARHGLNLWLWLAGAAARHKPRSWRQGHSKACALFSPRCFGLRASRAVPPPVVSRERAARGRWCRVEVFRCWHWAASRNGANSGTPSEVMCQRLLKSCPATSLFHD